LEVANNLQNPVHDRGRFGNISREREEQAHHFEQSIFFHDARELNGDPQVGSLYLRSGSGAALRDDTYLF
jgi:hypothetical protein